MAAVENVFSTVSTRSRNTDALVEPPFIEKYMESLVVILQAFEYSLSRLICPACMASRTGHHGGRKRR